MNKRCPRWKAAFFGSWVRQFVPEQEKTCITRCIGGTYASVPMHPWVSDASQSSMFLLRRFFSLYEAWNTITRTLVLVGGNTFIGLCSTLYRGTRVPGYLGTALSISFGSLHPSVFCTIAIIEPPRPNSNTGNTNSKTNAGNSGIRNT